MEAGVSRTPDERTIGLPDFPFESKYEEVDGLRLAYLDEGEGPWRRCHELRRDVRNSGKTREGRDEVRTSVTPS